MSFFVYDITFLVVFCLFLVVFLFLRRKKIQREGILILYRTQWGINLISKISEKYRKFILKSESTVIFVSYLLMIGMIFLIFQMIYLFIKFPTIITAVKIPPVMPLIPYLPQIFKVDFLPPFYFTYWIVVLAAVAIFHEFFHGIFAKANNVNIKSTGFAFLGPFLAAFVEQDEKQSEKLSIKNQLAFIGAGTFANVLLTILFFFVMWIFFILCFAPSGVIFSNYGYDVFPMNSLQSIENETIIIDSINLSSIKINNKTYFANPSQLNSNYDYIVAFEDSPALRSKLAGVIIEIDGNKIRTYSDLVKALEYKKPGEEINLKTLLNEEIINYNLILSSRSDDSSQGYLGISLVKPSQTFLGKLKTKMLFFKEANTYYAPSFDGDLVIFIYHLLWWMVFINFSVALCNMLPLGIFDGGRFFYLTILSIFKKEEIAKKAFKISTWLFLAIFALLTLLWGFNFF